MQNIRLRGPIRNLNFAVFGSSELGDSVARLEDVLLRNSPLRFAAAGMTGCDGSRFG
jgi:hypothetical protein